MKRVLAAAVLSLLLAIPCAAQQATSNLGANPCNDPLATLQSLALNASGTTAAQIIALASGKKIYICSITVLGGGTSPTFSLVYGTGTNCGTGQTVSITAIALSTSATFNFVSPTAVIPASQASCTLLTGTSPTAKGVLTYVQQ